MQKHQIVVPCHNESSRFQTHAFAAFIETMNDVHFLFVDDGSTDKTHELVERLQQQFPEAVSLLRLRENVGKGEAVRAGILQALTSQPTYVGFWDADLSAPLDEMHAMATILDTHPRVHMVFGSRVKMMGRDIHRKPSRHYLGRVFATAASITLKLPVYDTQCGAKMFRANDVLGKILKDPFISRWLFDIEMLMRCITLVGRDATASLLHEHPLQFWHETSGSKVGFNDFLAAPIDLWRIRRQALRK